MIDLLEGVLGAHAEGVTGAVPRVIVAIADEAIVGKIEKTARFLNESGLSLYMLK
jgi:hypothetical protein